MPKIARSTQYKLCIRMSQGWRIVKEGSAKDMRSACKLAAKNNPGREYAVWDSPRSKIGDVIRLSGCDLTSEEMTADRAKRNPPPPVDFLPDGKLPVWSYVWPPSDGGPDIRVYHAGEWRGVKNLQAARDFAAAHGYDGITVQPK